MGAVRDHRIRTTNPCSPCSATSSGSRADSAARAHTWNPCCATRGDSETAVATAPPPAGAVTTFGQTEWSPGEAVKFFRALAIGCLLPSSQTSYVLGLMQNIEASESWGLGSAGFSSVAFKGGWGPEGGGYLVRQSGIIDPGSTSGAAVAIVTQAPDFGAGTETLTRVASWLNHHLHLRARPSSGCSAE